MAERHATLRAALGLIGTTCGVKRCIDLAEIRFALFWCALVWIALVDMRELQHAGLSPLVAQAFSPCAYRAGPCRHDGFRTLLRCII